MSSSITDVYRSPITAATRPLSFIKRMWTDYFPPGTSGEEGVIVMSSSVLANTSVELNIVEEETNNNQAANGYRFQVELNIIEELAAEANNQAANAYRSLLIAARPAITCVQRIWPDYFRPGTLGEEGLAMPSSINPVVELNIVEELPAEANNQTANAYRSLLMAPIAFLRRLWADYFRPRTLGESLVDPVVVLDELPAEEANNSTFSITNVYRFLVQAAKRSIESVCRVWSRYFPLGEEGVIMKPGSAFKLVIICLFSLAAIKSQGETKFPFQTHPRTITVVITSLLVYGLASKAQNVISAARPGPGPGSVYAVFARLGGKLCVYILAGSMASLFYL